MKCFNCDREIYNDDYEDCIYCSAKLNKTKLNFISYIGPSNSLLRYQRSYKLLLLKYMIEAILEKRETTVISIISSIKEFYMKRKEKGLQPDFYVDQRISEIDKATWKDVYSVIKNQAYKVINDKDFLFINHNNKNEHVFVFNDDINSSMSTNEWKKLLIIIENKIQLYYKQYDENMYQANNSYHDYMCEDSADAEIVYSNSYYDKNVYHTKYKIEELFNENAYRIFVEYCRKNGFEYLDELKDSDFESLLKEPGFGKGELRAVLSKYNSLLTNKYSINEKTTNKEVRCSPSLVISESNFNMEISSFLINGITKKIADKLSENGYLKVGDLNKVSLNTLCKIYGKDRSRKIFMKLKIFEQPLNKIISDILNQIKDQKEFSIIIDRANGQSLQEIADRSSLSRERVRQIEMKASKQLLPLLEYLLNQSLIDNNQPCVLVQDILNLFNDQYSSVILYLLQKTDLYEYLAFADMFVERKTKDQSILSFIDKLLIKLIGEEGIAIPAFLSQLEEVLNEQNLGFIPIDAFFNYISSNFCLYGEFIFLKKQPYAKLCLIVIDKYFKDGINLHSDEDMNLLRDYFHAEFGEYELPSQNHAIGSRLSNYLILCDRGKANLVKNIYYEQPIIDDIKEYIDSSPFKKLYFSEIYNKYEGALLFRTSIRNYNGLHGLLKYLYKEEYEFSRDCIIKKDISTISLGFSERVLMIINEKGRALSKDEIIAKIGGFSDVMLTNAVMQSKNLIQWDYKRYNSIDNLNISESDVTILDEILIDNFNLFKGYCSDTLAYDKVKQLLPQFVKKNMEYLNCLWVE